MDTPRKLAAILAADIAGYSRMMGLDEAGTAKLLREHRAAIDPILAGHGGRIFKTTGDGVLVEFSSIVAAVESALAVQKLMTERNADVPENRRMLFRIGINLGDVLIEGDDILGDGVNVAARLEGIAEPGGICISDDSYRQVRGKLDASFEDAGEQQLKNITRPVRVYRIRFDGAPDMARLRGPRAHLGAPHSVAATDHEIMTARGDKLRQRAWHIVREYATHWIVAGLIIAATGTAPEEWFVRAFHALHVPGDALHLWVAHVDLRAVIVFVGVSIIVGDLLWRRHGQTQATPERELRAPAAAPSSTPPAAAEPGDQGGSADMLPLPDKPSIAVLPFANMSGDPEQEYFADGIAEDIITMLSRSQALFVIARNSSFTYKGRAVDVKQVARELGVRYVLEGSVRRGGNRVRITAQLIDAITGNHMWGDRYDRELTDIFAVQDEITEAIVIAIEPTVAEMERHRAIRKPPESLDAWEAYQRGLWHMARISTNDNEAAKRFFRRAMQLDPNFAAVHAELAVAIGRDVTVYQSMSMSEGLEETLALARRAMALDPHSSAAHITTYLAKWFQGDVGAALAEVKQTLAINPNYPLGHYYMGLALLYSGRPREAIGPIRTAMRLDPRDPLGFSRSIQIVIAHYFQRDYDTAIEAANEALRTYPNHPWIYFMVAAAFGQAGRLDEAKQTLERLAAVGPKTIDMYARQRVPWLRVEDYEHIVEGLRKAGWEG